jgi:hypothetical protein
MLESNLQAELSINDRLRLQWLLGLGLALLACWALWPLDFVGDALVTLLFLILIGVILRPALCYYLSPHLLRISSPFIVLFVAIDLFLSAPDFLPAVMRILVLLLFFRAASMRSGREDLQLLLLSLFTVMLSGVLTVSITFGIQILLFALLAMLLLFLHAQTELSEDLPSLRQHLWREFTWRGFFGRIQHQLNWKLLGFYFAGFIVLTIITLLVFLAIPRLQLERTVQLFQLNTQSRSGFSESIALGYVTEITLDNNIALRIDGPGRDALPTEPYWRMLVLDEYRGGRFQLSDSIRRSNDSRLRHRLKGQSISMDSDLKWDLRAPQSGPWVFYLEGSISRFLPLPGAFEELRFAQAEDVFFYPVLHNLAARLVRNSVFSYRIDQLRWNDSFPVDKEEASALSAMIAQKNHSENPANKGSTNISTQESAEIAYPQTTLMLYLNPDDSVYLESILRDLFQNDAYPDQIKKLSLFIPTLERWLNQNYRYSLSPDIPPLKQDEDPIVAWLREGSAGHCELFAGAFLLLARKAGHPARIVTGFTGGAWNAVENYFVVRNRNAHAWVEIYDAETQSWLRIDPTPAGYENSLAGAGVIGSSVSFEETGWMAWMDSLRILWYRRIVNFDHDEQTRLAERFVSSLRSLQQAAQATLGDFWKFLTSRSHEWFGTAGALGLPLLLLLSIAFVLFAGIRIWPWLRFSLNSKPTLHPRRLKAGKLLLRLRKKRSRLRLESEGTELYALEKQLEAIRFGPLTDNPTPFKCTFKATRRALRKL